MSIFGWEVFKSLAGILGLGGSLVFSLLTLSCHNLSMFWVMLELAGLCVIPCFGVGSWSLLSLFIYIVVSGISSFVLLFGMIDTMNCDFFLFFSFIIKMGVFPFVSWFYSIVSSGNWLPVLVITSGLKVPLFWVVYVFHDSSSVLLVAASCALSFVFISLLLWVLTYNFRYLCGHMLLASNASLLAFSVISAGEWFCWVFVVTVGWSVVIVMYFWWVDWAAKFSDHTFWYVVLLVACPVTFGLVYKVLVCYFMFQVGGLVMVCWAVYSVSEQVYLMYWVFSRCSPKALISNCLCV